MAVSAVNNNHKTTGKGASKFNLASLGKVFSLSFRGRSLNVLLVTLPRPNVISFLDGEKIIARLNQAHGLTLAFPQDKSCSISRQLGAKLAELGVLNFFTGKLVDQGGSMALAISTRTQRTEELMAGNNYSYCGLILVETAKT